MKYIGDLSHQDARILEFFASRYNRILEFGCGGSTQIMAQALKEGGHITSIDTAPEWIKRTERNLEILKVDPSRYTLVPYEYWRDHCIGTYDLIFVDGVDSKRMVFGRTAWHLLEVGGTIIYHDTRRIGDLRTAVELMMEHFNEVGDVFINLDGSNLSGFQRKAPEPYRDWNVDEGREPWMSGGVEPPDNWPELL